MSDPLPPSPATHDIAAHVEDRATTAILRMAVVRDQRAIDRLLDLLASPPSPDFFARLLESDAWPDELRPPPGLVEASPGIASLIRLKDQGKWLTASASGELDRMRGTAFYAVAVAAALAHHGKGISSAQEQELHPLLLDFAELTPDPWAALFEAAARRCTLEPEEAGEQPEPSDG